MEIDYESKKITCDCGKVHSCSDTLELFLVEPGPGSDLNKPILTLGCCMVTYTIPPLLYNYLRESMEKNGHDITQAYKLPA